MALSNKYFSTQTIITSLLFIICISAIGMRVSELARPVSSEPVAATIPGAQTSALRSTEEISPQEIAELNMFGEIIQMTETVPASEFINIPKTILNFTLNAVFTSTTQAAASAVIAVDNNSLSKRYFISEILPGNVILYGIFPDHVILKRDGRLEKLVFPRDRPE